MLHNENNIFKADLHLYPFAKANVAGSDSATGLWQFVCANQATYLNYAYMAGELHRKVKDYRRSLGDGAVTKNKAKALERRIKALFDFFNAQLLSPIDLLIATAKNYYSGRHGLQPRCTIKLNHSQTTDSQEIFDFARCETVDYNTRYKPETNTGFDYVNQHGIYYIENNIPNVAKQKKYVNERLHAGAAENYKIKMPRWYAIGKKPYRKDEEWVACWHKVGTVAPAEKTCYKSTLIIPISLVNNARHLMPDFVEHFKAQGCDKIIFGYLCFDHVSTDFFIEHKDVPFGYILADIFSCYLVTRLQYTLKSKTIKSARQLLTRV